MDRKGSVVLLDLPERLNQPGAATFLKVLKPLLDNLQAGVVLDCSKVQQIDSVAVETLLTCLEEAIKHGGGFKLAGVSPSSAIIRDLLQVPRLFEVFTHESKRQTVSKQSFPWVKPRLLCGSPEDVTPR